MDQTILEDLVSKTIPFGKYKGKIYCELPEVYIEWFARKGFPKGRVGTLLQTMYEINLNGLQHLLNPLKKK
ncbi:MAG TPA: DUF3820 family protein [Chitinophagaceae bacterium]|nr:DUF3820 family protein [Chitinophagaceae bacterium]MCC6634922.1 DUF3820 family protein [Chitinophagaceae bacterium]HMZ46255.1 DUF3820 family protein [Chitinophagaceae bacterium]HNE92900.1 DUF3820 family protein [Chitinophagaceae bacterium]HNF29156.1 DUF3820 family protein [Chitinophagaceae bacterium]